MHSYSIVDGALCTLDLDDSFVDDAAGSRDAARGASSSGAAGRRMVPLVDKAT